MVTAPELARRLRVDPKRLRAWLREEAADGHPLLGAHVRNARWEFSEEEASQLARAFSDAREQPTSPSSRLSRTQPGGDRIDADPGPGHRVLEDWRGEQVETLADLLRPDLHAVCVGINPSPVSVVAGHYYQGRLGRRFWQRLREADVIPEARAGHEDDAAFSVGIGFTDIVKRPTARAAEISSAELEYGRELLAEKLHEYRPASLILTFKQTATALLRRFEGNGHRSETEFAGAEIFVMPGPYERAGRIAAALDQLRRLLAS